MIVLPPFPSSSSPSFFKASGRRFLERRKGGGRETVTLVQEMTVLIKFPSLMLNLIGFADCTKIMLTMVGIHIIDKSENQKKSRVGDVSRVDSM